MPVIVIFDAESMSASERVVIIHILRIIHLCSESSDAEMSGTETGGVEVGGAEVGVNHRNH